MKEKHRKYLQDLGKHLHELRKQQGLSQQELANRCDVDRAKISALENATEEFIFSTFLEIAEGLGMDPKEILDFEHSFPFRFPKL